MVSPLTHAEHRCRICRMGLVELLSDAAGRIFGCVTCRSVNGINGAPPADVLGYRRLTRWERRRRARRHGRQHHARVPTMAEDVLPRGDAYVLLRREFEHLLTDAFRVDAEWSLGVLAFPPGPRSGLTVTCREAAWAPAMDRSPVPASIQRERIPLVNVGGPTVGYADARCPAPVIEKAFLRLWDERAWPVARAFLEQVNRWE